ncbi:MAG: Asp-tRNA(Asn)/Glu-tRNA(Gln) amidotransferase subunit GatC [Patescibacteria group bacterium]|nr:Asp-tRNA(Asn)/Glu-tRNA(Gln) amidotransferase subunit GatC [Patescibacteria group bacterium]
MKKKLTKDDIYYLADLINVSLTEVEAESFIDPLEKTVQYIENLNELKTEGVKPTFQTTHLTHIFFKDGEENQRGLNSDEVFRNTKNKKNRYFKIQKIR